MKYFYITAEGATAGPESLETLCAMMGSGAASLATLVVPAGGEDWTPLARVLRFFYQDAAGATAGPVAFSELNRLCQIHAIPVDAWVVEESGTDWKAVGDVLGAGGVALPAAPAPAPRVAHAPYRPQPTAAGNPYAPPHAAGHRVVVHRRATGGMPRLQYFILLVLSLALCIMGPIAYFRYKIRTQVTTWEQLRAAINDYHVWAAIFMLVALAAITVLAVLRIQNIGWKRVLVLILLAPGICSIVAVSLKADNGGLLLVIGLLGLAALLFQCALLALPQGFARHRRLDSAAWIAFALEVLVAGGLVTWSKIEDDRRREEEKKALDSVKSAWQRGQAGTVTAPLYRLHPS